MSKAVLVMDMPENCLHCKLQDWFNCRIVKGCHTGDTRPDWCPLRPMPEKREEHPAEYYEFGTLGVAYVSGYNNCIDKILGGAN